jgi:hypothetical protein
MPAGQRLPNNPLGLNVFSTIHDVVFLSALNPTPAHCKFLQHQGLTSEQIDRLGYCSIGYQAVMRCSLRDPSNKDPKNIIVPDRRLAEYLAEVVPGSTVRKFDAGITDSVRRRGRKRKHTGAAQRSRSHRKKVKEKRLELLSEVFVCNRAQDDNESGCELEDTPKLSNEIPIKLFSIFVTQHRYFATIYNNKKSPTPSAYLSCASPDAFIAAMAVCHTRSHSSKDQNILFSPAIFDPNAAKPTSRGLANIVYLKNLVLDFEEGDLRPEQFPELFPDLTIVVMNTFRHTHEMPRYRVIILTSERITAQVYEALFDAIARKLKDAGYMRKPRSNSSQKRSGLDHSKRSATSLFYLPCQAERADQSFFDVYNDSVRRPLDPAIWIRNVPLALSHGYEQRAMENSHLKINQARFDAAVSRWRGASPGQGNQEFYSLALELDRIGVPNSDIQSILAQEATFGRSPKQRNDQIPSIVMSLAKRGQSLKRVEHSQKSAAFHDAT